MLQIFPFQERNERFPPLDVHDKRKYKTICDMNSDLPSSSRHTTGYESFAIVSFPRQSALLKATKKRTCHRDIGIGMDYNWSTHTFKLILD